MINEPSPEFTDLEELASIPLSELVEPQWLDLPEIETQDLKLPSDYLQDLLQRGVIGEDMPTIDIDTKLLEGPEPEQPPFGDLSIDRDEPLNGRDVDFGR